MTKQDIAGYIKVTCDAWIRHSKPFKGNLGGCVYMQNVMDGLEEKNNIRPGWLVLTSTRSDAACITVTWTYADGEISTFSASR